MSRTRREMLAAAVGITGGVLSSGCLSIAGVKQSEPLGFAARKGRVRRADATHVVESVADLRSALSTPDATVWLPSGTELRLDDSVSMPISIAANVTLASDRGINGPGARITVPTTVSTVFRSPGTGIRVTGLRVVGPETGYFDPRSKPQPASSYYARAFEFTGDDIEIDHCELAGWTHATVSLGAGDAPTGSHVHHNAIHHNQMETLGYGLDLRNGTHLIEWNYFDHNRHAVAAFGHRENGYEARFNVVGPHAVRHTFDMHRLSENLDNYTGLLAGEYLRVHHTVFETTNAAAVVLRGRSSADSWVRNNWFEAVPLLERHGRESIVQQSRGDRRFQVENNDFGPRATGRGREWLREHAADHKTKPFSEPLTV
ncbi:hypothetical protein [Halocatena pleomorpha]|uniref:Right-handed parallel beta-helix repeat-containing protein n=1 Tax=Halocatena pleomorpha TaxID=1785090 RepID=A0A3P3RCM2_9EURY|nr:hypothetical protein [Halocatena pleomorpha]RRJ30719.1 hypothetical protein EIK79_08790 [Halocatena pleomorpha]